MRNVPLDAVSEYTRYKYVLENIRDIIWEMNSKMVFTFISPTVKETTGYEVEEMLGRSILDFLTKESREQILEQWERNVIKRMDSNFKEIFLYDVEFICKEGKVIWFEVSVKPLFEGDCFIGYVGSTRDISEKKKYEKELRKSVEELQLKNRQLDELATLDILTGTYNRRKFEQFAKLAMEKAARYGTPYCILMFDIDQFKQINDSLGHKKGDQILRGITTIVQQTLKDSNKLFRWGGDEFIILLPEITWENAVKIAEKVRKTIESHNFSLQGSNVTISIGVGEYKLGESLDQLVTRVDDALLKAKCNGKNKVEVCLMP